MVERNSHHQTILQDLRGRILLSTTDDNLVLHETELASEFGLSRTPIRRIVQTLVHEKLVTTQTGFGTVPTPLVPGDRAHDFLVYAQLARASAHVPRNEVTPDIRLRMLGIAQLARYEPDKTPEFFVRISQESAAATSQIVQDPILSEALAVSRYRVIRWLVQDCRRTPADFWDRTIANFDYAAQALTQGDAAGYLNKVADIVEGMGPRR